MIVLICRLTKYVMRRIYPRKNRLVATIIDQLRQNHRDLHRSTINVSSLSNDDRQFGYVLFICLAVKYWILTYFKSSNVSLSTTFALLGLEIGDRFELVEVLYYNECLELLLLLYFEDTEGSY